MTIIGRFSVLLRLVFLVLFLSACSGGETNDVGLDITTTPPPGEPISSSVPSEPTNSSGPSNQVIEFMFPISGAEMASANSLLHATTRERFRVLGECMITEGFDVDFNWEVAIDYVPRFGQILAYESLIKYGFGSLEAEGVPSDLLFVESLYDVLTGVRPPPEGMSQAEIDATLLGYELCFDSVVDGDTSAMDLLLHEFLDFTYKFYEYVLSPEEIDPDVVAAYGEFHQCVTDRGWVVQTVNDYGEKMIDDQAFLGAVGEAWRPEFERGGREAAIAVQIEAAVDYADCMVPVEQARQPIRAIRREEFIEQHFAEFIELEVRFQSALVDLGVG